VDSLWVGMRAEPIVWGNAQDDGIFAPLTVFFKPPLAKVLLICALPQLHVNHNEYKNMGWKMTKDHDKDIRYYIDIEIETLKITNCGYDHKNNLDKGRQSNPKSHRLFLTKGQYNKLVERCNLKSLSEPKSWGHVNFLPNNHMYCTYICAVAHKHVHFPFHIIFVWSINTRPTIIIIVNKSLFIQLILILFF